LDERNRGTAVLDDAAAAAAGVSPGVSTTAADEVLTPMNGN
jgi:hypothetical protein